MKSDTLEKLLELSKSEKICSAMAAVEIAVGNQIEKLFNEEDLNFYEDFELTAMAFYGTMISDFEALVQHRMKTENREAYGNFVEMKTNEILQTHKKNHKNIDAFRALLIELNKYIMERDNE